MEYNTLIFIISGLIIGSLLTFLLTKKKKISASDASNFQEENSSLKAELSKTNGKLELLTLHNQKLESKIKELEFENNTINKELVIKEKDYEHILYQKRELEETKEKFTKDFEVIANKIILNNSKELAEQHQNNLGSILAPFKESISKFEKKIEESYDKDLRDRLSLKEEVSKLFTLNQELSKEAHNLTLALKGDNKKQGNWGELILEKVLERSGLTKGNEYDTQFSSKNQENEIIQPDVIIYLPENKHLIIDAKVSLLSYDQFLAAVSEEEKIAATKQHIHSIKNHIKNLSQKNYHTGVDFDSPDFVLLFIPTESSFSLAIQNDPDLFSYAWDKKIVLVSPTTLLATLRTISSVWKQEKQTRNVLEIARLGGTLYDKFVGFLEDMEKINKGIDTTQKAYNNALKKLQFGNGNMIKTADKIRSLGAKANKKIPEKFIDGINENETRD